jgi:hypothetical protein
MISTAGLDGAREIIGRLRTNDLLPLCSPNDTGAAASITPVTPDPNSPGSAGAPATGTPLPDKPSEPGVDCRMAR